MHAQQVGPAVRPVIDVLRPLQQRIDGGRALVGAGVREKRANLFRRGERADHVEKNAADELIIVGGRGGLQPELAPFGGDQFVDVVVRGELQRRRIGPIGDGHRHGAGLPHVGDGDRGPTSGERMDLTGGVDLGAGLVADFVQGAGSNIALNSVGPMGDDLQLGGFTLMHYELARRDLQSLHVQVRIGRRRRPRGDPTPQQAIRIIVLCESHATAVRYFAGGFSQHQAQVGRRGIDPPSASQLHQRFVIEGGIKSKKRKLKPAASLKGPMTLAGATAELREQRRHVADQVRRRLFRRGRLARRQRSQQQRQRCDGDWISTRRETHHGGSKRHEKLGFAPAGSKRGDFAGYHTGGRRSTKIDAKDAKPAAACDSSGTSWPTSGIFGVGQAEDHDDPYGRQRGDRQR
jgi:hypothetical protein